MVLVGGGQDDSPGVVHPGGRSASSLQGWLLPHISSPGLLTPWWGCPGLREGAARQVWKLPAGSAPPLLPEVSPWFHETLSRPDIQLWVRECACAFLSPTVLAHQLLPGAKQPPPPPGHAADVRAALDSPQLGPTASPTRLINPGCNQVLAAFLSEEKKAGARGMSGPVSYPLPFRQRF